MTVLLLYLRPPLTPAAAAAAADTGIEAGGVWVCFLTAAATLGANCRGNLRVGPLDDLCDGGGGDDGGHFAHIRGSLAVVAVPLHRVAFSICIGGGCGRCCS